MSTAIERVARYTEDILRRREKWEEIKKLAEALNALPMHLCKAIGRSPSMWSHAKNDRHVLSWSSLALLEAELRCRMVRPEVPLRRKEGPKQRND